MRLVEIILFFLSILTIAVYIRGGIRRYNFISYITVINMIVLIVHSKTEGIRWQLYPIYLSVFLYFLIYISPKILKDKVDNYFQNKIIRRFSVVFLILMLTMSGISLYVFPIKSMDKPTGNNAIGTQSYEIIDPKREEMYGKERGNKRRIMIQVWYPTDKTEGLKKAPWIEGGKPVVRGIAEAMKLPSSILDHTAFIKSNSYINAELSTISSKYPVVIVSHGWTGFRNLHSDFAEELASHGYFVVSIDHTYGSDGVNFSDGSVLKLDRDALPDRSKTPDFLEYAYNLVSTYSGDISLVIDELEKWNRGDIETPFKGSLNLDKIGLIGHSTGGGGAVMTAIEDYRIKALIGFDAWVESFKEEELQRGLGIPSLFFRSEQWQDGLNNKKLLRIVAGNRNDTYFYQVQGTSHFDFTMAYMYSPLIKKFGISGSLNSKLGLTLQKEYIITFFNEYLLRYEEGETEKLEKKFDMIKLLQKAKKIEAD